MSKGLAIIGITHSGKSKLLEHLDQEFHDSTLEGTTQQIFLELDCKKLDLSYAEQQAIEKQMHEAQHSVYKQEKLGDMVDNLSIALKQKTKKETDKVIKEVQRRIKSYARSEARKDKKSAEQTDILKDTMTKLFTKIRDTNFVVYGNDYNFLPFPRECLKHMGISSQLCRDGPAIYGIHLDASSLKAYEQMKKDFWMQTINVALHADSKKVENRLSENEDETKQHRINSVEKHSNDLDEKLSTDPLYFNIALNSNNKNRDQYYNKSLLEEAVIVLSTTQPEYFNRDFFTYELSKIFDVEAKEVYQINDAPNECAFALEDKIKPEIMKILKTKFSKQEISKMYAYTKFNEYGIVDIYFITPEPIKERFEKTFTHILSSQEVPKYRKAKNGAFYTTSLYTIDPERFPLPKQAESITKDNYETIEPYELNFHTLSS